MPIEREELFISVPHPAMYIVTTNAFISQKGTIVMGRGAAQQLVQRIDGIHKEAGDAVIEKVGPVAQAFTPDFIYGFVTVRPPRLDPGGDDKYGIGIFQVKYHFKDLADIKLIANSMKQLRTAAGLWPNVNFRMNYPGIGNGKLKRDFVEQFILPVPDNVTICYR
jgi:hypothetical protein